MVITLNEFRVYRPIADALKSVLNHPLNLGQVSITLGGVLLFGFSVYLAFWVAKTVRVILQDDLLPKMSLPRGVGNSISSLSYYALLMAGLFFALAAAGFEVSQLAIVVGALSVGIGFGLQNVVNNFVSGLILMFERPIQPGDVVEVSGTSGKVREIGMRATTLSTFEGADVVVPNGMLLNEKLINWTLSDMDRRLEVNVGVAYGTDPRRVMDLLMEVSKSTPGVAATPEPAIVFTGFGPSSLDFSIRAWTNTFGEWVNIRSELAIRVHDALRDAGISIPFPQQECRRRGARAPAQHHARGGRRPRASGAAARSRRSRLMLIEGSLLGPGTRLVTLGLSGAVLALAALSAPWRVWLEDRERQWVWLASLGLLVGVWSMKAGISPGLSLRFLMVTALTLMHGWQLAVIGGAMALAVLAFVGQSAWSSFGADLLCVVIVPALVTAWLHELVHARLPHNYFIYFFVTVFAGSALAYNLAGLSRVALLAASGSLDAAHVGPEYFAVLPLMSFGEAFVNGMVMAMAVVYRPKWVMSFDDRLYLTREDG